VTVYDVGDQATLRHEVRVSGVLTDATVVLSVTAPDGTVSTPSVTHASTGVYTAPVPVTQAGPWTYVFTMSGTVIDVAVGTFSGQNPQPPTYITLAQLKSYLRITDATEDDLLLGALASICREIDKFCQRRFYADLTATAREYDVHSIRRLEVDDFWTTTGLVVEGDYGGDGTFETTIASTNYKPYPLNGIVDGESGWPFNELRAVNVTWPTQSLTPGMRVTAKWGWAAVPAPVVEATKILASETFKLKGAPFGVASFDQFGPIRVRDNPMAAKKLSPYVRSLVLVA
jgi:hypothetical protein